MTTAQQDFINKIGRLAAADMAKTKILASLTCAQAILESAWGTSELATKANALFGIKVGSGWSGKTYTINTQEFINGQYITVQAAFRAYDSWEDSVTGHSNLLTSASRYANLIGEKDYKVAAKKIKDDGYATSPTYTEKLIKIIEDYGLSKWDTYVTIPSPVPPAETVGRGYVYEKQWTTKNPYWNLPDIQVGGFVLHSIGCPQPKAQVLVNDFNKPTCHASVHGFIEPGKLIETAPMREVRKQAKKCYHVGSGAKGSYNATHLGIEMCEPATIQYTAGSAFKNNDPAATKKYMEDVTATAAEVFADLCIFHELSVDFITTHHQAYLNGMGSGHADPEHIWITTGCTLDKFRKMVKQIIDEKKEGVLGSMTKAEFEKILDDKFAEFEKKIPAPAPVAPAPIVYKTLLDVPDWGKKAVGKAMAAGIVNGTGKDADGNIQLDMSFDFLRTIQVLSNLGLFDKIDKTDKTDKTEKVEN